MQNTNNLCMGCMKDTGGAAVCPVCGQERNAYQNAPLLPLRTWLEERYLVGNAIEQNGEGVTYLGWDNVMQAPVRIREFLPLRLVTRAPATQFITVEQGCERIFSAYLNDFLALARNLAHVRDLTAVFSVYDIFESNGTAYYISEHVESITLERFLNKNGGTLNWEQTKTVMIPVLSTLQSLHEAGIVHGGISPQTIQVCRDGKFRLNAFAISALRSNCSEIDAQLFPGYAAVEQYSGEGRFGPATDIYGYSATVFRILSGAQPPLATDRVANDRMVLPAKCAQTIPDHVLQALVEALQIMPADRNASAGKLCSLLSGSPDVTRIQNVASVVKPVSNAASQRTSTRSASAREKADNQKKSSKGNHTVAYAMFALIITVALLLILLIIFWGKFGFGNSGNNTSSQDSTSTPSVMYSNPSSKVEIPSGFVDDIEKLDYAEVLERYSDIYDIIIEKKVYSKDFEKGLILSQSPAKNTEIQPSDLGEDGRLKITVTISLGNQYVTMPDLTGMSEDEAILTLVKAGFDYDNIVFGERYHPSMKYKHVVDTEPAAGTTKVDINGQITLNLQNTDLYPDSSSTNQ